MQVVKIRVAAAALALTLLVCVVAIGGSEPLRGDGGEPAATPERTPTAVVAPPARFPVPGALPPEVFVFEDDPGPPGWLLLVIAAGVAAALIAAGVLFARGLRGWDGLRRRSRARRGRDGNDDGAAGAGSEPGDEQTAVARRAVEAALAPLRDPTDPRGAVIAAYASMESVLAERELGRRAPEAPREYLGRVLREHGMPELSLTTLTELFEEARFSTHPVPDSAPGRARAELERARASLAATRPGPDRTTGTSRPS